MQNKSGVIEKNILHRLKHTFITYRQWIMLVAMVISGFVMSNSFIFGGIAPFGAAFCAALSWKYVMAAALGSILGHMFSFGNIENMKYIAAILFIVIFKWLASQKIIRLRDELIAILAAFVGMGAAGTLVAFTADSSIYEILSTAAEVMLCCSAAYFFTRTAKALEKGITGASRVDFSCIAVSFSIIVMGFSSIEIYQVSLGRVIAVIVILLSARYGAESGGAIAGITAGIALGLTSGDFAYTITAYAFGGLIAGIFGRIGRLAAASSFVLVNAIAAIFVSTNINAYSAIAEIFIASVIFVAIPTGALKKIKFITSGAAGLQPDTAHLALKENLRDISSTLRQISSATSQINKKLGKIKKNTTDELYTAVAEKVCRHCGMRTACWQDKYNTTMSAISDCIHIMRKTGSINREEVPSHFSKTCVKSDSFLGELNTQFQIQVSREGVARKVSQVREVVTDQFDGMAMILDEISNDIIYRKPLEKDKYICLHDYFESKELELQSFYCYTDNDSRAHVEFKIPAFQITKIKNPDIATDISALLETEFDMPQIQEAENILHIRFSEKACFTISSGAYQICNGHNKYCGDSYKILRDKNATQHIILSDGMGSGGNAAIDSTIAVNLISNLLNVGIGHQAALKMVNSALLIKSGDESLATIDVCSIDLFTGEAELYKAGAAPTYILRGGKAAYLESASLPAGILRGVSFEKSLLSLAEGDIIIMVSDGLTSTGANWIISEIKSLAENNLQDICERLCKTAQSRFSGERGDDITVIAVKLEKGL